MDSYARATQQYVAHDFAGALATLAPTLSALQSGVDSTESLHLRSRTLQLYMMLLAIQARQTTARKLTPATEVQVELGDVHRDVSHYVQNGGLYSLVRELIPTNTDDYAQCMHRCFIAEIAAGISIDTLESQMMTVLQETETETDTGTGQNVELLETYLTQVVYVKYGLRSSLECIDRLAHRDQDRVALRALLQSHDDHVRGELVESEEEEEEDEYEYGDISSEDETVVEHTPSNGTTGIDKAKTVSNVTPQATQAVARRPARRAPTPASTPTLSLVKLLRWTRSLWSSTTANYTLFALGIAIATLILRRRRQGQGQGLSRALRAAKAALSLALSVSRV
jgi:hypothetical protein